MRNILALFAFFCWVSMAGCTLPHRGDEGPPGMIAAHLTEPLWIRNGEPVMFESEAWLPTDEVESFLDSEIYQAGTYRDVLFYIEKSDIRPFARIYTYFSKNRYRAFER